MLDENRYPNIAAAQPQQCSNGRIRRIHKCIANIYRKHIGPFGITGPQLSILFLTAKLEQLNQSRLAKILILEKSTASRNLQILMNKKLLVKEAKLLKPTTSGLDLLEKVIPEWTKAKEEVKKLIGAEGDQALDSLLVNLTNPLEHA